MSPVAPTATERMPPHRKLRLAFEIFVAYLRVRLTLARGGLRESLARLRGEPAPPEPDSIDGHDYLESVRLGSAVGKALRLVPADTRCLMRSLVLTSLLARRGIGSSLVIGVRSGDSFGAHAWVEVAERPLLPPGAGEYERLVAL